MTTSKNVLLLNRVLVLTEEFSVAELMWDLIRNELISGAEAGGNWLD